MKSRSFRRAGALLLALALVCSLLTLPVAAAPVTNTFFQAPQLPELLEGSSSAAAFQFLPNREFDLETDNIQWITDSSGIITITQTNNPLIVDIHANKSGTATFSLEVTILQDHPSVGLSTGDVVTVPCTVTVRPKITSISFPSNLTMTAGDTRTLNVDIIPSGASVQDIEWTSSNPSAVEVQNGVLTAQNVNQVTTVAVTASTAYGVTKTCNITVNPLAAVTDVKLSDGFITPERRISVNVSSGQTVNLTATVEGSSTEKGVNWDSSNSSVKVVRTGSNTARVTASGAPGTQATVYAKAVADPTQDAICVITVVGPLTPEVNSVTITSPNTDDFRYLDPHSTMTLTAVASPADASELDREITWSSSDESIATVNPKTGVVRGVSPGEAVITARSGGSDPKTSSREIEVSGILLSYIEKSSSGGQGKTIELTEKSMVDIYQQHDITVSTTTYGSAKQKTITWTSSNNSVAQAVAGRVTANYPGEAIITAIVDGTGFSASFQVRVSEDMADAINVDMGSSPTYSFSGILSELDKRSQSKAGAPLESIYNLNVSTENGILYYRYTSSNNPGHGVGGTERYYYQAAGSGQMAIRDVTFVPLPGFGGTAVVDYNAAATSGTTFTGTIRIQAAASGDVTYSTGVDQPVDLVAEHFSDICKGRSGRAIGYVTFTQPAASRGTLYYNYSSSGGQFSPKVDSFTRYYASSNPSIDGITFVPAAGFIGDVTIPYRCTDSSGAAFSGTITITVSGGGGGTAGTRDVEYSTGLNQRQDLNGSDFNDASQRATGYDLDCIRFDSLPSSNAGTLYLDYTGSSSTQVTAGRNYYRSSTPRISNISFVPARNYSGTASIPFTGTNTNGKSFSGNLVIHVADGTGTVHYNTSRNQAVTFSAADFNDACRRSNGTTLSYIRFTSLPSSGYGTLYYNYGSASSTGSRVSTDTDYRRSGSPSLSNVTFVPASGYDGTVSIPFTGYDDSGVHFSGTVTVTVGNGSRIISYNTTSNGYVRFNASDFNSACRSATGDTLNYVRFDTVSTTRGTLYYQYNTATRTGTSVSTGTGYYYSGSTRLLGGVTFAANARTGTATIGYTGYSVQGDSFSGTVEVTVSGGSGGSAVAAATTVRYTGSSAPIHFRSSDFQTVCQAALGTSLSYVQFNALPSSGRLYQNYSGPARTGTGVSAATRYGLQDLDQISYVPKAEYQGTLTIPYTAYDAQGATHSSAVEIQLSNGYCTTSFTDVAYDWDWAKPSIEYLRQSGITSGYRDNTFRPGQSISRGEFTLMICRAFQFPTTGSPGFPDVPAGSTYAGAVAAARDLGIVQGNNGRFHPDQPITRQSAMTMICRALDAAGQSVPAADSSLLSSYVDGAQVSAFARPSVASLIQMGAVRGNSAMRLNPSSSISRAEMAVILHRVLTR